ncbi:hypothetical protein [Actinomycetospora straminea]|uniref:Transglycosylase-like protein with SLT domain n=1 Tax=Actinomycetospora straminea TaxID=663607 RepID=A0ABP9DZ70_9PSEU|nr:hypothetical protein [Actinomycetospora straminea]MDD7931050.1 hypothetical protein [Actinomycetospora straminea]
MSILLASLWLVLGCTSEPPERVALPSPAPAPPASPVGVALPSGEACTQRIVRSGREVRSTNAGANATVPEGLVLPPWPDYWDPVVNRTIVPRIDGQFTGTTEEIMAWGACKWGFDPEVVRAVAWTESSWFQDKAADVVDEQRLCVGSYTAPCPTSFGLLQIKHIYRPGSYPLSAESTAFNVDYGLAVIRGCYEGRVLYLRPPYQAGDLWGCLGWHYSGEWMTPLAQRYMTEVSRNLHDKPWTEL